MRLKSFNYLISLLVVFFYFPVLGEEKIDIWKNKKEVTQEPALQQNSIPVKKSNLQSNQTIQPEDKIQIQEGSAIQQEEQKVYGIFDPANFDFNLNMWSSTSAEDLRLSLKRIDKIELSTSSNEILEAILFSFSYPPKGMSEKSL